MNDLISLPIVNTNIRPLFNFAQAYGTDAYGVGSYQCDGVECQTTTNAQTQTSLAQTGDSIVEIGIISGITLIASVVVSLVVLKLKKHSRSRSNTTTL